MVPVVHEVGADTLRSTAHRVAGESLWAPTALVPGPGVHWSATDDAHVSCEVVVDGHAVRTDHVLDDEGRIRSSVFERWGDPDHTGTWGLPPFGVQVTAHRTFGGSTIPSAGVAGWHAGTPREDEGAFFRFEITAHRPVLVDDERGT